jgi:hypothetical protein
VIYLTDSFPAPVGGQIAYSAPVPISDVWPEVRRLLERAAVVVRHRGIAGILRAPVSKDGPHPLVGDYVVAVRPRLPARSGRIQPELLVVQVALYGGDDPDAYHAKVGEHRIAYGGAEVLRALVAGLPA